MKTTVFFIVCAVVSLSAGEEESQWRPILDKDKRSVPNLGDEVDTVQHIPPVLPHIHPTFTQNEHNVPLVQYRSVPIPVQHPIAVPVQIPVEVRSPVPVHIPVPVPVVRTIPLPVDHPVAYPVLKKVPFPLLRKVPVPVVRPYPVPVPVYKTRVIDHGVKHTYDHSEEDWW